MSAPGYVPDAPPDAVSGGAPVPVAAPPSNALMAPAPDQAPVMLGPPPEPPALTGDPTQDVQANLLHQRALYDHIGKLTAQQTEIAKAAATVASDKAAKELATEQLAQAEREKKKAAEDARRAANQEAIQRAVHDKAAAAKEVEGFKWDQPLTGGKIVSAIFGGIASGLGNSAAAKLGQVGNFENESLKTIHGLMQKDYEAKKLKYANASDALLEARFGYKDAEDNRRAADNEADADLAAKYHLIGKEAEAQLKRQGVADADIQNNLIVANARAEQAKAEGAIHEREEKMQVDREHARATEQLARATLSVQQGHLSVSRQAEADTHADRMAALAAREADKAAKAKEGNTKAISSQFDKDEARLKGSPRSPGLITKQEDIRQLGNTIREAAASGDHQAMAAAIVAAKEKIARLNTGAAPSHEQMKLLNNLSGTPAEMEQKLSRMFGDPKVAEQTVNGVLKLVDQSDEHATKEIDTARDGLMEKYLGPNGIAKHPEERDHVLGRIAGLTGTVTTRGEKGETPRYQEGGAGNAPPAPARPAAMTIGGAVYHLQPDGTYK